MAQRISRMAALAGALLLATAVQAADCQQSQLLLRVVSNDAGWQALPMRCLGEDNWGLDLEFSGVAGQKLQFDINGNWDLATTFGDRNADGVGDLGEAAIPVAASGYQRIRFNPQTRNYSISAVTPDLPPQAIVTPALIQLDLADGINSQQFDASSSSDDGELPLSFAWAGSALEQSTFKRCIAAPGLNSATVTATDAAGQHATATGYAQVIDSRSPQPPLAVIKPVSAALAVGQRLTLDGSLSFDRDGGKVSYSWSTGGKAATENLLLESAGEQSVTLTVTDDEGQSHSSSLQLTVADNAPPTVLLLGGPELAAKTGASLTLTATAADSDGYIASYAWDGQPGTSQLQRSYDTAGEYPLSVTVTDNHGLSASAEMTVVVTDAEQPAEFKLYFDAKAFASAPTIWAWITGGSEISKLEGFTWDNQQQLSLDQASGYYVWLLDESYQAEVKAGKTLNFILNKGATQSRSSPGCLSDGRWFDTLGECLNKPFSPYIGPYLTLLNPPLPPATTARVLDPATSMVINYELQNPPSGFVGKALYRKKGDSNWIEVVEDKVAALPDGFGKVHHITLTGLTPETRYEYKVVGANGQQSAQYHFDTAATNMDYSRFLLIGDMQDEQGKQRWQDIADAIVAGHMSEFDFIITVGDMVKDDEAKNGDRFYWWKVFFDKGQNLFAYKPMLPTMGNHDTPANPNAVNKEVYWSNAEDTRSFRKYFYMTMDMSKPDYYSFNYGNATFMAVNSEIPVFYGRNPSRDTGNSRAAQESWLQQRLNDSQNQQWTFVYAHVPHINPAGGKDEVQYMRPQVDNFNGKLDWSLTGHVHQYQRLKPAFATSNSHEIKANYGRGANQGVGYLISPPAGQFPRNGGADMGKLAYYPNHNGTVTYEIGFSIIQLDGGKFSLRTYGMGDSEVPTRNPSGYGDNRGKKLLDSISYDKGP